MDARCDIKLNTKSLCSNYLKLISELDVLSKEIRMYFETFFDYFLKTRSIIPNFDDFKIGNIVFAGCIIGENYNFRSAIKRYAKLISVPAEFEIIPATVTPYYLAATSKFGGFFPNEAAVVNARVTDQISRIYQFTKPLSAEQIRQACSLPNQLQEQYLETLSANTDCYDDAVSAIENADIIIYGAGTPFSSVLPSLQNEKICQSIVQNTAAKKIMIGNLKETGNYYNIGNQVEVTILWLSHKRGAALRDVITDVIVSSVKIDDDDFISTEIPSFKDKIIITEANILDDDCWWKHDGKKLYEAISEIKKR